MNHLRFAENITFNRWILKISLHKLFIVILYSSIFLIRYEKCIKDYFYAILIDRSKDKKKTANSFIIIIFKLP